MASFGSAFGFGDSGAAAMQEKEAELRWMATQEQVRRMQKTHGEIISQAQADVGASGFTSGSMSQQTKIADVQSEFQKQENLSLFMGQQQYDLSKQAAGLTRSGEKLGGITSGIQFASMAAGWFA